MGEAVSKEGISRVYPCSYLLQSGSFFHFLLSLMTFWILNRFVLTLLQIQQLLSSLLHSDKVVLPCSFFCIMQFEFPLRSRLFVIAYLAVSFERLFPPPSLSIPVLLTLFHPKFVLLFQFSCFSSRNFAICVTTIDMSLVCLSLHSSVNSLKCHSFRWQEQMSSQGESTIST